jgi:hypothetical protein
MEGTGLLNFLQRAIAHVSRIPVPGDYEIADENRRADTLDWSVVTPSPPPAPTVVERPPEQPRQLLPVGLVEAYRQTTRLAGEQTALFLVLVGLTIDVIAIASKIVPGINTILGNLGPVEYVATLAAGSFVVYVGTTVRISAKRLRETALRHLSDAAVASLSGATNPRNPSSKQ